MDFIFRVVCAGENTLELIHEVELEWSTVNKIMLYSMNHISNVMKKDQYFKFFSYFVFISKFSNIE